MGMVLAERDLESARLGAVAGRSLGEPSLAPRRVRVELYKPRGSGPPSRDRPAAPVGLPLSSKLSPELWTIAQLQ